MRHRLTLFACLFAVAGTAACTASAAKDGLYSVGETPLTFNSPATADGIQAQVWYPVAPSTGEREVFYTTAYWGHAAPDAPVQTGATYPLVLLAHGWRGTRFDMAWLAEDLARHGYIVAALNSPGTDAKTYEDFEAPKMWFRAVLLQQLVDAVAHDERFANVVDTTRVAVMGHSAGGSTALVMGGAKPDPYNFEKVFPQSAPVPDGPWRDTRVKAVVAMNPGTGPAFAENSFTNLSVPVLILSGSSDHTSPEPTNAKFYADHIAKATWHSVPKATHYTFTQECSPYARFRHFPTCSEIPGATDRAVVHAQSCDMIRAFLAQVLGKPAAPLHASHS